jgi:hypothetical protein
MSRGTRLSDEPLEAAGDSIGAAWSSIRIATASSIRTGEPATPRPCTAASMVTA